MPKGGNPYQRSKRMKRVSGWHEYSAQSYERVHRNPKLIMAHINRLRKAKPLTREEELAAQAAYIAQNGIRRWCEYDGNWGDGARLKRHMTLDWRPEAARPYVSKTNRHFVRSRRGAK